MRYFHDCKIQMATVKFQWNVRCIIIEFIKVQVISFPLYLSKEFVLIDGDPTLDLSFWGNHLDFIIKNLNQEE